MPAVAIPKATAFNFSSLDMATDQQAAAVYLRLRVCYSNTNVNRPELLAPFFNAGRD